MTTDIDIKSVRDDIKDINLTLKDMNGKLERLAIVEERYTQQSEGLTRAFAAIEKAESKLEEYAKENNRRVDWAFRWIWTTSGTFAVIVWLAIALGNYVGDWAKEITRQVSANTAIIQRR